MVNDEKHTVVAVIDDQNHKKPSSYAAHDIRRIVSTAIVVLLILVAITFLVLWLLYHPHKPKFTVVGAAVYGANGNTSFPPTITTMQIIINTRNPNNRVPIYYEHLTAFLTYNYQAITPPLMLPPLYHESDSTVAMSPIWPVWPAAVNGLVSDDVGVVSLRVVMTGKLRWKVGSILKTRRKGVYVGCDVLVGLKRGMFGQVPLVRSSECEVDV